MIGQLIDPDVNTLNGTIKIYKLEQKSKMLKQYVSCIGYFKSNNCQMKGEKYFEGLQQP